MFFRRNFTMHKEAVNSCLQELRKVDKSAYFSLVTRWNLRRPSFSVLIANWQAIKPHIIPNGENVLRKLAKR